MKQLLDLCKLTPRNNASNGASIAEGIISNCSRIKRSLKVDDSNLNAFGFAICMDLLVYGELKQGR